MLAGLSPNCGEVLTVEDTSFLDNIHSDFEEM